MERSNARRGPLPASGRPFPAPLAREGSVLSRCPGRMRSSLSASLLLLLLAGCATENGAARQGSLVVLEPPDESCTPLGPVAVRMSTELLMSEDVLLASAVSELRRRAALDGATHLVISRPESRGLLVYGTNAAASGLEFRCPDQR